MKVLIIGAPNHTVIGGGEKYIRKVIDIGKEIGCEFEEIYLKKGTIFPANAKCHSQLLTSCFSNLVKYSLIFKVIDYKIKMAKIGKFLKNNKFDMIIVNTSVLSLNKKYLDKSIFIQHEDNQLYEKFARHFYFKIFGICTIALKAKNIVCYTQKSVSKFVKISPGLERNYYIANLFTENLNNFSGSPKNLVYLGRICKEKGVDLIVKVAELLNEPIHLYGAGPYEIVNKKNIVLHGAVSEDELKIVFENAKLNILLSKSEGLGFSVIEGFSYGVPCLLIDSSTNAEYLIDNGNNGILCAGNADIKEIAHMINNFDHSLFSPSKIKQFCANNFHYDDFKKEWKNIFSKFVTE